MKKYVLAACSLLSLAAAGGEASANEKSRTGRFLKVDKPIVGQYVVVLKDEAAREVHGRLAALEREHGFKAEETYEHAIRGFMARMSEREAMRLAADPSVDYVAEDGMIYLDTTQTGPTWGLDRIDQRATQASGGYTYAQNGTNVHVYVIDTGIRASHSEFGGRVSLDYTGVNDGNGASDCNGHGTHVAGTIGGATWGVAKNARLHAVRVFGCSGGAAFSTIIAAIDWVRANATFPAVINMSLGGGAYDPIDTAVQNAVNAGITVVVAAGNENVDACTRSPARAAAAITVGATTNSDARASFSNFGTCVDIFAPGQDITSSWWNSDSATNTISGTSMATPHVAGAAALYLQSEPSASPAAVAAALVNGATNGTVSNPGTGSPNRLLFTLRRDMALRASTGHYVVAEDSGGREVLANRGAIGPWERFGLFDLDGGGLQSGDYIHLEAHRGLFVVAENAGGSVVNANRVAAQQWETLRIWKLNGSGAIGSGDTVALQAPNGMYVVAEGGGGGVVNANRTAIGAWEQFVVTLY